MKFTGFYHLLQDLAQKYPDKTIVSVNQNKLTFKNFCTNSENIANNLTYLDIKPKDHIGIILPNCTTWYEVFWAIVKIGAIPIPLNPQIGSWEIQKIFSRTGIKACIICEEFRGNKHLEQIISLQPSLPDLKHIILAHDSENQLTHENILLLNDLKKTSKTKTDGNLIPHYEDTLLLACTSGTTGNPKIIAVEHGGFFKAEMDMAEYLELTPDDIMIIGMPLYHLGGFGMGLQQTMKGGKVIYQETFNPEDFLKTIETEKVSVIQISPTLAKILFSVPNFQEYDLSNVRMFYFAGEVLSQEIADKITNQLGKRVINIIGSTETTTMVIWDSKHDRDVECNVFKKLPFTDFHVRDENDNIVPIGEMGEIHIQTDGILQEYYDNPVITKEKIYIHNNKRWFKTGDLGKRITEDRIKFMGRNKRVIKRGGNLIYPEEIETFLIGHPDIEAVAVTSEKNNIYGEMIIATVQIKPEKKIQSGTLRKYCAGKIAHYKIPDEFVITDNIPLNMGKIEYKQIRSKT